jgi:glycosyltransferase involved in cell wall biosynthesis
MLPLDAYRFTGFLSDVRPVLWASDVYVLPTLPELGEGLPVATLEAMAAGLPVIASDLPPLREVVVPGETGFLTEPGQAQDLSSCIARLTLSPELRRQMAAGAVDRVKSKFSQDRMVEKTADVYRELHA